MRTVQVAVLLLWSLVAFTLPVASQNAVCPDAGEPVSTIDATTVYDRSDVTNSKVDLKRSAENEILTAPVNRFLDVIAELSDRIAGERSQNAKTCSDQILYRWAGSYALLKAGAGTQPHYVQQWAAATLGLARLKTGPLAEVRQDQQVSSWLRSLAESVNRYHRNDGGGNRNNHFYWALLGIGSIGLTTASSGLWDRALVMETIALSDIRSDGTLSNELIRGERAARYHATAALPLAVFQLLRLHCTGDSAAMGGRLIRLIDLVRSEMSGVTYIDKITNTKQLPIGQQHWLSLWEAVQAGHPNEASGKYSRSLGGSLRGLALAISSGCPQVRR